MMEDYPTSPWRGSRTRLSDKPNTMSQDASCTWRQQEPENSLCFLRIQPTAEIVRPPFCARCSLYRCPAIIRRLTNKLPSRSSVELSAISTSNHSAHKLSGWRQYDCGT